MNALKHLKLRRAAQWEMGVIYFAFVNLVILQIKSKIIIYLFFPLQKKID